MGQGKEEAEHRMAETQDSCEASLEFSASTRQSWVPFGPSLNTGEQTSSCLEDA